MADQDDAGVNEPGSATTGTGGWGARARQNLGVGRLLRPRSSMALPSSGNSSKKATRPAPAKTRMVRPPMVKLDDRERLIGFFAAAFELAIVGVVIYDFFLNNAKVTKADFRTISDLHIFVAEDLVLALCILIGSITRRRALVGFGSLIGGMSLFAISQIRVIGLAYVIFAIWVMMKGFRSGSRAEPATRSEPTGQPRSRRRTRAETSSSGSRSAPKPNKRYTPPRPPRRTAPKKPVVAKGGETPKH
ncbi:MAG: hypothetical protein ABR925_01230 [Acidimicrobiales bacterium]|jgi:hypothetical protein